MRNPMPKAEWGVKRTCPTTGKRFYDLGRTPPISPYTGDVVEIEIPGRKGVLTPAPAPVKEKRPVAAPQAEGDEEILVDDDAGDIDLDDELLEDEEDDTVALDDLTDVAGDDDEA